MHASQTFPRTDHRPSPRRSGNTVTLSRDDEGNYVLFRDLATDFGCKSNLDMAHRIGCGEGTISRLRNDEQKPGPGVIAGVAMLYADRPSDRPLTRHFNFGARGQR